jgi:hypothetical protein
MGMRAGRAAALGVGAGTLGHSCGGDRNLRNHHGLSRSYHRPQVDRRSISPKYLAQVSRPSISPKSGIAMVQTAFQSAAPQDQPRAWVASGLRQIFIQGFLTNAVNPKVAAIRWRQCQAGAYRAPLEHPLSTPWAPPERHGKRGVKRWRRAPTSAPAQAELSTARDFLHSRQRAFPAAGSGSVRDCWVIWLLSVRRVHWVNGTADTTVIVEASAQWRV